MYHFFIYEDNPVSVQLLTMWLEAYTQEHSDFEIATVQKFESQDQLEVFKYGGPPAPKGPNHYNIYVIDLHLGEDINGFTVARHIRSKDPLGYILFYTSHLHLAMEAFEYSLKAISFIDKASPAAKDQFYKALDQIQREIALIAQAESGALQQPYCTLSLGKRHLRLNLNRLLFVEKEISKRSLNIHMTDTSHSVVMALSDLMANLPDGFVRCHKSFIINTHLIERIERDDPLYLAAFENGKSCPISKRYLGQVLEGMNRDIRGQGV